MEITSTLMMLTRGIPFKKHPTPNRNHENKKDHMKKTLSNRIPNLSEYKDLLQK